MACKHFDKKNKICNIKNKFVTEFDCNKCMLKIENSDDYEFNFRGTPFEGLINNMFKK